MPPNAPVPPLPVTVTVVLLPLQRILPDVADALTELDGCVIVIVVVAEQLFASNAKITDLAPAVVDMADTAAQIAQLDLVISVDTSVAHLTGALGKPLWLLLSSDADWRWLMQREDSPWYPTMRLFRQTTAGDWSAVFERIAWQLAQVAATWHRSPVKSVDYTGARRS